VSSKYFAVLNSNLESYKVFLYRRKVSMSMEKTIIPQKVFWAIKENDHKKIINISIKESKENLKNS